MLRVDQEATVQRAGAKATLLLVVNAMARARHVSMVRRGHPVKQVPEGPGARLIRLVVFSLTRKRSAAERVNPVSQAVAGAMNRLAHEGLKEVESN